MTSSEVFPAIVYLHEGALQHRLEGFYNTQIVGCRYGKVDLVWPILDAQGQADHELDGRNAKRVFHVDLDLPEMEVPFAASRKALLDWRGSVLSAASKDPRGVTPETVKLALDAKDLRAPNAAYLAQVFAADMKPDVTAKILKRTWLEGLLVRGEAAWPLVIGALVFGLLEGWQLADTILPDVAKSPWFSLMLPLALLGFVVMLAFKEG